MRSIRFLLSFSVFLLAAGLAFPDGFYIAPHLQNITPDAVTIIWETQDQGQGVVEYGLGGKYDQQAKAADTAKIHRVRVTGLQPATEYTYRVRAGADELASAFKTAPVGPVPVTFVILGDSRRWDKRWEETKMAAHSLQWKPDFYLNMGDLVLSGHKYEQWPEHFKRFSEINHSHMILTARGNHEGSMLHDKENDWFAKYHELPGAGEPFASFDWGNTHFALISYEQTLSAAAWLDEHLPKVDRKYRVVSQHYPVYCTGYAGPADSRKEMGASLVDLARTLDKHNVAMNLSGHTHIYERHYRIRDGKRDDARGALYVVNGGDIGGNYPEWWTAVSDNKTPWAKPTYTVVWCRDGEIEMRSFCWSLAENQIIEIDHVIMWSNEATPKAVLAELPNQKGAALTAAIERLGAMTYAPAVPALLPHLKSGDAKVRESAAAALRAIGSPEAANGLLPCLADTSLTVRRQTARAFEIMMPETLAADVVKQVLDANQDEEVRVKLMGALQLHAPAALTLDTALQALAEDVPAAVRQRAAYAVGRVATKEHAGRLTKLVQDEKDDYVLTRLGWTLNNVTGQRVSLDEKAPFRKSEPGNRRDFIQQWQANAA